MGYIDMHCDTLLRHYCDKTTNLLEDKIHHVSLQKLKEGGALLQCFAHFDPKERFHYDFDNLLAFLDYSHALIKDNEETVRLVTNMKELDKERINALFTLEDGGSIHADHDKLEALYQRDVRMIALTWNFENCFGFPNSQDPVAMAKGLKPFGFAAVEQMNALGMLVDVSHLSDGGFWDVAETTKAPFVASHSNCRAIKSHPRNLTDEMIRAVADSGGVIGVNFLCDFLSDEPVSCISAILRHMRHLQKVGGADVVALGGDYDGISCELELSDASKMPLLWDAMAEAGFAPSEIEKIMWKNTYRVMEDVLR